MTFDERSQKARKNHTCYWCGEAINVGVVYQSWIWAESEDFERIKAHTECAAAWMDAAKHEPDGIYLTGPSEHCRGCSCEHGFCKCVVGVS